MINRETRKAAWQAGKTRYFTGQVCKHGHLAERFVSSGGCVQCVSPFKQRKNAFTKDAIPYAPTKLWARATYTAEQLAALEPYLQQCIDAFDRAACPELSPLMHTPPVQTVGYQTAPEGSRTLPSFDSLPSADVTRSPKCKHGVDVGYCTLCDEEHS
jgi:hypothetical protein